MRTEEDLCAAFSVTEQAAPPVEPALAGVDRRIAARRRRRVTVTVVAVVAAVVVTTAMVSTTLRGPQKADVGVRPRPEGGTAAPLNPRPTRPAFSFTVKAVDDDAVKQKPYAVSAAAQWARVWVSGLGWHELTVYEPGAFDPGPYRSGNPVTVSGHQGFFRYETYPLDPHLKWAAMAWQYAPDAWAVVRQREASEWQLPRVAEKVVLEAPRAVKLPFRFDALPAGLAANYVEFEPTSPTISAGQIRVMFDRPGVAADDPNRQPLLVMLSPDRRGYHGWPSDLVAWQPLPRTGHSHGFVTQLAAGEIYRHVATSDSEAQDSTIINGLVVADWNASATWFDANQTLGG